VTENHGVGGSIPPLGTTICGAFSQNRPTVKSTVSAKAL
jgi:hypothetical protein